MNLEKWWDRDNWDGSNKVCFYSHWLDPVWTVTQCWTGKCQIKFVLFSDVKYSTERMDASILTGRLRIILFQLYEYIWRISDQHHRLLLAHSVSKHVNRFRIQFGLAWKTFFINGRIAAERWYSGRPEGLWYTQIHLQEFKYTELKIIHVCVPVF